MGAGTTAAYFHGMHCDASGTLNVGPFCNSTTIILKMQDRINTSWACTWAVHPVLTRHLLRDTFATVKAAPVVRVTRLIDLAAQRALAVVRHWKHFRTSAQPSPHPHRRGPCPHKSVHWKLKLSLHVTSNCWPLRRLQLGGNAGGQAPTAGMRPSTMDSCSCSAALRLFLAAFAALSGASLGSSTPVDPAGLIPPKAPAWRDGQSSNRRVQLPADHVRTAEPCLAPWLSGGYLGGCAAAAGSDGVEGGRRRGGGKVRAAGGVAHLAGRTKLALRVHRPQPDQDALLCVPSPLQLGAAAADGADRGAHELGATAAAAQWTLDLHPGGPASLHPDLF